MAVVGLIALLDLVVLWWISSWAHHVATEAILVAERILGMLLVALGIQLTIIGLVRLGILAIPVPT